MNRKYHLFDAQDKILGRLSSEVSRFLSGKYKVDFAPHIDGGDYVVVINSDRVAVSGNKRKDKIYYHYSGYPGGIKAISFKDQLKKDSRKIIKDAIYSMLPKNKLRDNMIKRLLIYKDDKHSHKIDVMHK